MNYVEELFKDKDEVTFYVPIGVAEDKISGLIVDILDSITAYVSPLLDGLSKGDVYDYITSPLYEKTDLLTFLKHKRYLTDEAEFIQILLKYSNMSTDDSYIKCYEVALRLRSASSESINEVEVSDAIVSLINDHLPTTSSLNLSIKRTNYLKKLGRFSYIVSV